MLTDVLYCFLLRLANFQKDYKKVILHEPINVHFSHVVRLIHGLKSFSKLIQGGRKSRIKLFINILGNFIPISRYIQYFMR